VNNPGIFLPVTSQYSNQNTVATSSGKTSQKRKSRTLRTRDLPIRWHHWVPAVRSGT